MSSIKAIAIKNRPREAMLSIDSAQITVDNGIAGDFRGSQPDRQITILGEAAWHKACAQIDADLPWTVRRANLLVEGVEFNASFIGKSVTIGDVELVITEETAPCSLMDAQHQGLTTALTPEWRGGVCCKVVIPGDIKIGDRIEFA
ncbi:MAG: MOSC domain-containing protein [Gammaproteobacteria bacterium]|nr:MOSC domain-containing protein [Gammaproteobacteria bacterium]